MRRACALIGAAALLVLAGCGPTPGPTVYIREAAPAVSDYDRQTGEAFVLNPSSGKFHRPGCAWAEMIDPERRIEYYGDRQILVDVGYLPCHFCKP